MANLPHAVWGPRTAHKSARATFVQADLENTAPFFGSLLVDKLSCSSGQKMPDQLTKAAIIYDFDGTLARGSLQECSFIPKMNLSREQFWDEVKRRTKEEDADEILVYMHLMLEKAKEAGKVVSKQMLRDHGKGAKLFGGLAGLAWFTRMNQFAARHGLELQHYIVSSGIEEMIRGCSIQGGISNDLRLEVHL